MKTNVTFTELRQHLASLLDRVESAGDKIYINRHGKPVAVISPVNNLKKSKNWQKKIPAVNIQGVSITNTIIKMRE